MIHLERLGPGHAPAILAGQDPALAAEIIGEPWTAPSLHEFLDRAARWRADGPIREFAALDAAPSSAAGTLLGGGGLNLLDPGLDRGEAVLTYWVLAEHRGRGHGHGIAAALVARARADARIAQLVLRIAPENAASQAVARAAGAECTAGWERHPAAAGRRTRRWVLDVREA